MSILKIKKVRSDAKIPYRATEGSAGMDLYACIDRDVEISSGNIVVVPTGISIALESEKYVALIYARSGLAIKHGIAPANCVGVIDSDYRGEVCVGLTNFSIKPYVIRNGERIAQLVVAPVDIPKIEVVDELDDTQRSSGGFGSTGRM